jgi:hypothetical protein
MADERYMDFDAARAESEEDPQEPLKFKLGGDEWEVRSEISGALLMDFILAESVTDSLRAGKELLLHSIDPGARARFDRMLKLGKPIVPATAAMLGEKNVTELRAIAKQRKLDGVISKMGKPKLVKELTGKSLGDPVPPPSMPMLDEVIAWLVRMLIGRPTTQ